jgi:hypothetical protein
MNKVKFTEILLYWNRYVTTNQLLLIIQILLSKAERDAIAALLRCQHCEVTEVRIAMKQNIFFQFRWLETRGTRTNFKW